MSDISNLEPKTVFRYFDEISAVPRCSGCNEQISSYLVDFAKSHGYEYYQDDKGNVIIYADATPGYENADTVMIQGHMDMVAAVRDGSTHDFKKDPIDVYVDGDMIKSRNTTLGADDGIALAMALAMLDDKSIEHPALEVVATVDEEIGMLGAGALDGAKMNARKILNVDSEEEGLIIVGCAGAVDCDTVIPVKRAAFSGTKYSFSIEGLQGGHSGNDINLERANAANVMGMIFKEVHEKAHFNAVSFSGGSVTNAILDKVSGELVVRAGEEDAFEKAVEESAAVLKNEYRTSDPGLTVKVENLGKAEDVQAADCDSQKAFIDYLVAVPAGVQNMSAEIEGLVETSLSIGVCRLEGDEFRTRAMIRSSVNSRRDRLRRKVETVAELCGGHCEFSGEYGAWEFNKDSELLSLVEKVYEEQYGEKPAVGAVHAGVECGKWAEKLGNIDAVSFGPDMLEVHSVNERLSISSTQRTWELLKGILAAMK